MQTNRFETFIDAIIAIVMTVLVLKLPQPATATMTGLLDLQTIGIAYFISFMILFNIWYHNHNLFQVIDEIDNTAVWFYGIMTFIFTLLPYFTIWLANNVNSVPAETAYGFLFLATHVLNSITIRLVSKSNPYNKNLSNNAKMTIINNIPLLLIIIGFVLTYTIYTPGIYITCLLAVLMWVVINNRTLIKDHNTERFEALIDAILAIIITIIVLEIPLASTGSWDSLFELKYEFLIYAVSFIICFNFWNFNNNLFGIVNRIDYKVIWTMGITLFLFSLLPYFTTFIANNFYSFFAQFIYGLLFIITALLSILMSKFLKSADKGNIALQVALNDDRMFLITVVMVIIGYIIGYFIYPPAIIIFCLMSIVGVWIIPKLLNRS